MTQNGEHAGSVTLVPAGLRSLGRCLGNHSHQPDGNSVGTRLKEPVRRVQVPASRKQSYAVLCAI